MIRKKWARRNENEIQKQKKKLRDKQHSKYIVWFGRFNSFESHDLVMGFESCARLWRAHNITLVSRYIVVLWPDLSCFFSNLFQSMCSANSARSDRVPKRCVKMINRRVVWTASCDFYNIFSLSPNRQHVFAHNFYWNLLTPWILFFFIRYMYVMCMKMMR